MDNRRVLREPTPVVGVRFAGGRVYFAMEDGREIGEPIKNFPRLVRASDEQRANWQVIGLGVHWPDIDEDLSVAHMLGFSD